MKARSPSPALTLPLRTAIEAACPADIDDAWLGSGLYGVERKLRICFVAQKMTLAKKHLPMTISTHVYAYICVHMHIYVYIRMFI